MTIIKAKIYRDNAFPDEMFVLLDQGRVALPILHYQLTKAHRSLSWHRQLLFSVRLFSAFIEANANLRHRPKQLFQAFSWRLIAGTIDDHGGDPSGLYWRPRRMVDAQRITNTLSAVSDYLSGAHDRSLNPLCPANRFDCLRNLSAWKKRNSEDFLGHLTSSDSAQAFSKVARYTQTPVPPKIGPSDTKAFPDDKFHELIFRGFETRPHESTALGRLCIRDILITILLHGGGLRVSESFHLWIDDVRADGDSALVRIGHPTEELVRWRDRDGIVTTSSRAEYLARHGLTPRNKAIGPLHAGWKNPALDRKWHIEVHWSDLAYGRLFLALWKYYLLQIAKIERRHPWAWISLHGNEAGQPYKLPKYHRAHQKAIARIQTDNPGLDLASHSHRHAYAKRLRSVGVSEKTLKCCLHHNALCSQQIYTASTLGEIQTELERARADMNSTLGEPLVGYAL